MKKLYVFLFLSFILFVVYIILRRNTEFMLNYVKDSQKNIGNILATYFYNMGNSWSLNEDFNDSEGIYEQEFYKLLPKYIKKPENVNVPEYKKLGENAWIIDTEEGKLFWETIKPYVHDTIDKCLKDYNLQPIQKNPIIHFRCSDVPFNGGVYHFQRYDFFKKSLGSYKEVDIVTCNKHESTGIENQKLCEEYTKLLSEELINNGIKVNIFECREVIEDFARMFYAPLVISPGSSMSFIAGYFGNGEFITSGHILEEISSNECKICKYSKSCNLFGSEINDDYKNVSLVHEHLKHSC